MYTTLLRRLGCIDLVYTVLRLADHQDMLRSLALAALANGAAAQTTTAGLTIAVDANAAEASAVGAQLAVVDAAISEDGWTAGTTALDAYEAVPAGANTLTLETIGTQCA